MRRLTREEHPYGRSHLGYRRLAPVVPKCMCNLGMRFVIQRDLFSDKVSQYNIQDLEMKVLEEILFTMFLPLDLIVFYVLLFYITLFCISLSLSLSLSR